MVWDSHLCKNFPQFIVIHTVKDFSVVNEAEVFLEFSCFFYDPTDIGILISGSFLPRSKRLLISWLQSPSAMILEPRKISTLLH